MLQSRVFRFFIPPVVLLASMLWGLKLSQDIDADKLVSNVLRLSEAAVIQGNGWALLFSLAAATLSVGLAYRGLHDR